MTSKLMILLVEIFLSVQMIYGELQWKTFMFYDIVTESVSSPDSLKQLIKVYQGPINDIDIKDSTNVTTVNVDTAFTLEIDDSKFSEYIMAALINVHSYYKIQNGVIGTYPNKYRVYRFHPHAPFDDGLSYNGSNLHSFGIGINTDGSGTIMLDVWLTRTVINSSQYTAYIDSVGRPSLKNLINKQFILRPNAKHLEKVKFDYMVAGLINYKAEPPVSSGTAMNYIEVIENPSGNPVGLRFHTPRMGLGLNP